MEQVIQAEHISVTFPGKEAVRDVSFALYAGEFLALVGESGSGKTMLCRSILGLPPKGAAVAYQVLARPALAEMSLIMQNAMTALDPVMTVGEQIAEANRRHPLDPVELLAKVGVDRPEVRAGQYPGELSGGMRQRAAVAVALAMRPKVIFADEPTTSLDPLMGVKMMELLKDITREGAAVLLVTHDISLMRGYADRVLIMKEGAVIESGTTEEIFAHPHEEYTKELLRYAAMREPANHTHGKVQQRMGGQEQAGEQNSVALPLVEAKDLSKWYPFSRGRVNRVLEHVNIAIYPGEITGLCGPSGIGKSTLARCLAGLEKPSGGRCLAQKDMRIQMIFQDSVSALNPRMTVEGLIAEPLYLRDKKRPPRALILGLMEEAGLEPELMFRYPGELSGGQRQRVAIARAISARPDLIIADEPVSSLDVTTRSKIIHLLKRLKDEYHLTILLISHDLHLLAHVSDRILRMEPKNEKCERKDSI